MMQFTEEQRATLIADCKATISLLENIISNWVLEESLRDDYKSQLQRQEIALTALMAEPLGYMTDIEVEEIREGFDEAYIYKSQDSTSSIPIYTASPVGSLRLPGQIDGSKVAYVHLDETTRDKVDAYVRGANWMLDEVKRLNGYGVKND